MFSGLFTVDFLVTLKPSRRKIGYDDYEGNRAMSPAPARRETRRPRSRVRSPGFSSCSRLLARAGNPLHAVAGIVPDWLFSIVAVATVFTVMFDIGLAIVPGDFRSLGTHPGLMLKGLFSVLVAVPALAWIVARALDLPRAAEVGIMLMAISPGAPVALRRSLGAGADRSFAPALQIAVAALAVISMPLSIAAFDEYYGGSATVDPDIWRGRCSRRSCSRSLSAC